MDKVFESENIIYVRPSFDLVPDYLEMVNLATQTLYVLFKQKSQNS